MIPDDLDRILAPNETVQPSSAFTKRVMAAIHRETVEPPPLPFPWVRFGIGVTASSLMAAAATTLFDESSFANVPVTPLIAPIAAVAPELSYAAAVMLIGFAVAALPRVLSRP